MMFGGGAGSLFWVIDVLTRVGFWILLLVAFGVGWLIGGTAK